MRNVDASPEDPVEAWPAEVVRAALERGGLAQWRRLAAVVSDDPWGPGARRVQEAVATDPPYGSGPLMDAILSDARAVAARSERETVAAEVRALVAGSGLTQAEFAGRIGTSASRLSTYLAGSVSPSAALMVRMRRAAQRLAGEGR